MPSTSVHFPPPLLERLNRIAAERGISRNRVIVEACRRAAEERPRWPDGFFRNDHLRADDLELLQRGGDDWLDAIVSARRSRERSPF